MNHASSHPVPEAEATALPWYRHPLVWLVIALPASAIVGGLATLAIAITHADATVDDHWYRDGKAINRSLEAEHLAARLGIVARLGPDGQLTLGSAVPLPWPPELTLTLRHPAFAERDRIMTLSHRGGGRYRAAAPLPTAGAWNLTLAPPEPRWRLNQRVRLDSLTDAPLRLGQPAPPDDRKDRPR